VTLILFLQFAIMVTLIVSSRRRLEDALPFFAFFLVLMPLEARVVIPGLFDFNTMRLSLLTLLILYVVKGRPASSREPLPLRHLMLLHIGWVICSTIYSLSVATSAKQLLAQLLEFYLMYYLIVKIISDVDTIYKIIYAMIMAMGVCCIFSLMEAYATWSILRIFPKNLWITYNGGLDPLYIEWGRGLRVRSTFPHPILFGDALAMSIPLTIYMLSIWNKGKQRFLLWATLVLMFWAIYRTSSRGPWIATGICSILLFFMVKKRVRKYLISIAALALIALVARPGIWDTINSLYESSTDTKSPVGSSYLYRHVLTETIEDAVQKEPGRALLGYGLGTFRELGLNINFLDQVQRWYTCDNNWALFLYETGYVGLVLVAILLFKPLLLSLHNYRKLPPPGNYLNGVLFISLAGFYFLLLSVAGYCWGQQGYMSWILISLSISLPRVTRKIDEKKGELENNHQLQENQDEYALHAVS
jgi:O-antigen ligase/polysaccharide polymerase Wzy-like membrane protein